MEENKFDSLLNSPAAPQDASTAAFVAESRENRERCYEMSEQMTREVAGDAGAFQKYLDLQSHFDRYGANNVLLIMAQMPGAERIGDYGYWKEKGAYLKKQERKNPILILEPGKEYEREDGSIGTYYNAKKVYDISQTTMNENIPGNSSFSPELKDSQLIRALVSSPPILLIDELTANLDDDNIWDLMHLLNELNSRGTTIVMATHASQYVNIMRRRVVTLVDGKLVGDVRNGKYGDIV